MNAVRSRRAGRAIALLAGATVLFSTLTSVQSAPGGMVVPTDAQTTCMVAASTFAGWFQSGSVSANGIVKPADGLVFPNSPNCSFYQWAEQMFLWVTSPAPTIYGPGAHVFDSAVFYDVSPPDASGNRHFVPHLPVHGRVIHSFALRTMKPDAHGLQIVFSRAGRPLEVVPPQKNAKGQPLVLNAAGALVPVQRIVAPPSRTGKVTFVGANGAAITNARPSLRVVPVNPRQARMLARPLTVRFAQVQRFTFKGIPIFIDGGGNIVQVEQGQADGSVLMSQKHSLVYYGIMVNDVFAYFLTGNKDGAFSASQFPTTSTGLSQVTTFASAHGKTFPDPNALAVELKTSWVEASTLPSTTGFITTTGTVPVYNTSNPNHWTQTTTKTVELALVGMHLVASVNGHPELLWATFEQKLNEPLQQYTYNSTTGPNPKTVSLDTTGNWTFCCANHSGPFDLAHMNQPTPGVIASVAPFSISPSDTVRQKTWGAASNVSPNPIDGSTTNSNTEIISINHSVLTQLASGDIRTNYLFMGETWTIGGAGPNSGNQVGTSMLQNSTLETYDQGTDSTGAASINCFTCHTSNQTAVSHIYGDLKPLF